MASRLTGPSAESLLAVADRFEPDLGEAYLRAVAAAVGWVDPDRLLAMLERGDIDGVVRLFNEATSFRMVDELARIEQVLSAVVSASGTATGLRLGFEFNRINPRVLSWIRASAATTILGVSGATVDAIRRALLTEQFLGEGAAHTARVIRPMIGLTPGHVQAVSRYWAQLLSEESPVLTHERIEDLVATYRRRLEAWRATTIARTETMRASNMGQYETWLQMADAGVLNPERVRVVWMVTDDDRLCPLCAPMEGKTVRLGKDFRSDQRGFSESRPEAPVRQLRPDPLSQPRDHMGRFKAISKALKPRRFPQSILTPPLHPQCRCTLALERAPIGRHSARPNTM